MEFYYSCFKYSYYFFFSSRRRHMRCSRDWSSDVCSSYLLLGRIRGDGLDDFSGLDLFGEVGGNRGDKGDVSVVCAGEHDHTFEIPLECFDEGLEVIAFGDRKSVV